MSAPAYDMTAQIANIKRRCAVPTSQLTYTDQDFTDLCNDELQGQVVPLIMSTREEFFVKPLDISSPYDGIIDFPTTTVASKVRSVCYLQQTRPLTLINLPRIDLDIVTGVGFNSLSTLAGFYIQGNKLVLYPNSSVPTGTPLRIYLYERTLKLAPPSAYGQILSIDTMANSVVLDFVPVAWTVGMQVNSVSNVTPFAVTNNTAVITALSSPTVVFDDVTGMVVGDYVSEYLYSAVPQIPIEAHAYLAQMTAQICLEGLGDAQGAAVAMKKAEALKESLLIMISQRVDGSVKKIMNPNGGLRLGAGIGRWGRGWSGGNGW